MNYLSCFLLKKYILNSIAILCLVTLFTGCSVKKNTGVSRAFHAVTTHYNIYFNGTQSYEEGLKNIEQAVQEDYSTIIPMYPVSYHNTSAATGNMDKAIEKSRKAIKVHSIKQKPKKDYKRLNDPKYLQFYDQQEFNSALKDAWLLLAKSEFHKGDFLGSVGTFSYISKLYSGNMDMVVQCQLWTARAYAEMDWMYEAEEVLSKINQDHVSRKNTGLFAAVNADFLLKNKRYAEAVPFLELALSKEKDKNLILRFNYLLAQLYQHTGYASKSYNQYTTIIRKSPPYELDFNARINRMQLNHVNVTDVRKELNKMIKNLNNKDYLDQLYFALGNTYLQHGDTVKAIENYVVAADTSTRAGIEKAIVLVTLGDLYYQQKKYVKAQPAYDEASKILPNTNDDYARVSRLSETLGELVFQYEIVVLQDSLLHLSTLSSEQQLVIVNKIIENLIAEEKAAAEKALAKENADADESVVPLGLGMGAGSRDWYFYNPNLMRTGQAEFQRQWGRRKLEDNWRRANKAAVLFAAEENAVESMDENGETLAADSVSNEVSDNKKPEFYLRQIPATPEQKELANTQIAAALFEMGLIYKDKIEDFAMAEETFNEFVRRYGTDERVPDAYFQQYILFTKNKDEQKANMYRAKILSECPDTKYAQILYHDDYAERFARMYRDQDSIYNLTYKAYSSNDFAAVFANAEYMRNNYPLSTLMPKFLFLKALSVGKTDTPELFDTELSALVETYPTSDVSAMAKDIIALIRQGQESKTGTSHGSLLTRREEIVGAETEGMSGKKEFSTKTQEKHRLMIISAASTTEIHQLMYQIASYNFSRFMIKEFDFVVSQLDSTRTVISVTGFESYDEVVWYKNAAIDDVTLNAFFQRLAVEFVIISEVNFGMLRTGFTLEDYLQFREKESVKDKTQKQTQKREEKPVVKTVEIQTPTVPKKDEKTTPEQEKTESSAAQSETSQVTIARPEEEIVPLYKNLYAYQPKQPHHVAIYVLSGTVDFGALKAAFDTYNAQNYGLLNLTIASEKVTGRDIILIGSFTDAEIAKSYFLRMIKEQALLEGLKGTNYRNMLGTQKNLNVMIQENAMNVYFEFMREYYLK